MKLKNALCGAVALLAVGANIADAQPGWVPPGNDPRGYYSDSDHNGYYDHNGTYTRMRGDRGDRFDGPPPPPPPPVYEQGRYESNCHQGNQAAGTVFGALAGGLIGGAASRGNGGAVVGGAILGGLLGNTISRDVDCDDQPEAFRVYASGLNGSIGYRSEWRHGDSYGYFTPTREFRRNGVVCRDFTETSYSRGGRAVTRTGTACHETGGNWRFD